MWESSEQKQTRKVANIALVLSFITGLLLWVLMSPIEAYSLTFWVGMLLMGFPGYCALESLGSAGLSNHHIASLPRWLRISFGVLWLLICMMLSFVIFVALSGLVD